MSVQSPYSTVTRLPAYAGLVQRGEIGAVIQRLSASLDGCRLCPEMCGRSRRAAEDAGACGVTTRARVSWATSSVEELRVTGGLVGVIRAGESGVHCVECEQLTAPPADDHVIGNWTDVEELAGIFRMLEDRQCRAIHWVAATPCLPFLVAALEKAARRSLNVPIGLSTNGYIRSETVAVLDGLMDSYQVELSYADSSLASRPEYTEHALAALSEMYRQVGSDWLQASDGTLLRGLLVHVRVVPDELAGLRSTLESLATATGPDLTVCLRASPRLHTLGDVRRHVNPVRELSGFEWHVARSSLEEMLPGGRHLLVEPERFSECLS